MAFTLHQICPVLLEWKELLPIGLIKNLDMKPTGTLLLYVAAVNLKFDHGLTYYLLMCLHGNAKKCSEKWLENP